MACPCGGGFHCTNFTHSSYPLFYFLRWQEFDLKKPLKIKYVGGGEQGLDMGGLQKEFFHMIVEAVFDPGKYPNLSLAFKCCTNYKIIYVVGGIRTFASVLFSDRTATHSEWLSRGGFFSKYHGNKVYSRDASVVEIPPVTRASRKSLKLFGRGLSSSPLHPGFVFTWHGYFGAKFKFKVILIHFCLKEKENNILND